MNHFRILSIDTEEKTDVKVDSYRHGYKHGTSDTYTFIEKYSDNRHLHSHLLEYIHRRELEMGDLTGRMLSLSL